MIKSGFDIIAQWPNIVVISLFTATLLLLQFIAQRLGGHNLRAGTAQERNSAALDTFRVLGPLAGVFLSFSLVQGIAQYRATTIEISGEAADAYQLDRSLSAISPPAAAISARLALRSYIRSVATSEWGALRQGIAEDPGTIQKLNQLQEQIEKLVNQLNPDIRMSNDIDKNFDDLQDDHAKRLGIVRGNLPSIIWWVLGLLMGLLLICTAFLAKPGRAHPLPILYMAGLGMLSGLLFIIDRPFQGELSVSPAPLVKVLKQLDLRLPS